MSPTDKQHAKRMMSFAEKKQKAKEALLYRAFCAGWDGAIIWTRTVGPDAQGRIIFSRYWKAFLEKELGDDMANR
jgi:hypothetical protein